MKKKCCFKTDKKQEFKKPEGMSRKWTKPLALTLTLSLLSVTACAGREDSLLSGAGSGNGTSGPNAVPGGNASVTASSDPAGAGNGQGNHGENVGNMPASQSGTPAFDGLKFLCTEDGNASCATEEGYYYISTEEHRLQDGSFGYRLMYMDYASCREICLCSTSGCAHDTKDCTAVLPYEEFPAYTSKLFLHQGALYILSRQYDSDNSYSASFSADGENDLGAAGSVNPHPAVLYRMNPDGTGRQKVFSFDPDLTLEGALALDGQGLYAVSKKLSSQKEGIGEYISSAERTLVFLDLSSYSLSRISAMEFGDDISWKLTGCANGSFLLEGIDYGGKLTAEEYWDDDVYPELYKNSHTVFALLDTASGSPKEFYRIGNEEIHSTALLGNSLYVSFEDSGKILAVDVSTGQERLLATHPQNYIMGTIGNMLCCQNPDTTRDPSYYFINTDTGEIRHSGLVNKSLGWSLDLVAETESDVLVIYDYDAVTSGGTSYEIRLRQYGLISKEDLFSGNDQYRKIQMAGRGY